MRFERGTLKLTLSNRVPRDQLILGKTIGGFISLMVPLVIPFVIGLIMLLIFPNLSFTGEDWIRVGSIFVLFLLYLSVFFTLGLLVSSITGRSSSSLFILLFIWVTFIFVIPKAAVIVAGQINPIPSVHEITAQKDAFCRKFRVPRRKKFRIGERTIPWAKAWMQLSGRKSSGRSSRSFSKTLPRS